MLYTDELPFHPRHFPDAEHIAQRTRKHSPYECESHYILYFVRYNSISIRIPQKDKTDPNYNKIYRYKIVCI